MMRFIALAIIIAASSAPAVEIQDATALQLAVELSQRGIDRWGCWTQYGVMCRWDAAPDPNGDDLYELQVRGRGWAYTILRTYHIVAADSIVTWWPAGCDTLDGRVRAWDPDGYSDWSDWGEVLILEH